MIKSIEVTNNQGSITYETETIYGLDFKFETYGNNTYIVISDIIKKSDNTWLKEEIKHEYRIFSVLSNKYSITNIEYSD